MPSTAKLPSIKLAKLIIDCYEKKPSTIDFGEEHELIQLIRNKKTQDLAYWLHFHSFLKYKLEKIIAQEEEANIEEFPLKFAEKINELLFSFLKEQKAKQGLTRYLPTDFVAQDYIHLIQELETMQRRFSGEYGLLAGNIAPLLNAKNRSNQALQRAQNIVLINCADYAAESTVRKLSKNIANLAKGERKQFFYYHLNEEHAIGFDVERDSNGEYKIFCFESAADPRHLETVDLLYKKLTGMRLKFQFKSCISGLQRDRYNCAIYTFAALSEFSKYDHVFDYLPVQYEEDKELGNKKETVKSGRVIKLEVMDKISWVKISDLPTKIIAMSQSHDAMKEALKKSTDFDLDPEVFVDLHKQKYNYDSSHHDSTKYVNRRRSNIQKKLAESDKSLTEKAYSEYIQDVPLLSSIDQGREVDFKKEITNNNDMSWDEKIHYIEKLFLCITQRAGLSKYMWKDPLNSLSPIQFRALLLLRNEYLHLLAQKPLTEVSQYLVSTDDKAILNYRLEQWAVKIPELNIEPLHSLFKKLFKIDDVILYYNKFHFDPGHDLTIKNPLLSLFNKETKISAKHILQLLESFALHYSSTSSDSLYDTGKQLNLVDEVLRKISPEKKKIAFILASPSLNAEMLLQEIEAVEAYVLMPEGKFYYINKKENAVVELRIEAGQLEKIKKAYQSEFDLDNEGVIQAFSLATDDKVKCLVKEMPFKLLNAFTTILNHNLYTPTEEKEVRDRLILREVYLQLLANLFEKDKGAAVKKLFHQTDLFMLEALDLVTGDFEPVEKIIKRLFPNEALIYFKLVFSDKLPPVFSEAVIGPFDEIVNKNQALPAKFIVKELEEMESRFCDEKGHSPLSQQEKINFLLTLCSHILSTKTDEDAFPYLEEIATAYITILNITKDSSLIEFDHIPARVILYPLLGEKKKQLMTVENALARLSGCSDILMKLKILEVAFNDIRYTDDWYPKRENEEYSKELLVDIDILQQAYVQLIKNEPYDRENKKFNNELDEAVKHSPLMDFTAVHGIDTKQRKEVVAKLAQGKGRLLSIKMPVMNENTQEARETSAASQEISTFFKTASKRVLGLFKPEKLEDVVAEYYRRTAPNAANYAAMERYQTVEYKSLNFKLGMFHFSESFVAMTRWVIYERCTPAVKTINEDDWKLNLAIHKDDLHKAFPIIAACAGQCNLGILKVMSQAQADFTHTQNNKNMLGREVVVYCNANPEFNHHQWIAIITKIEQALTEAGIRQSTDISPASNRKIGKYTSYTHGAWTAKVMDIPFEKGIKETALDDEDLFADYQYDDINECPKQKTTIVLNSNQ